MCWCPGGTGGGDLSCLATVVKTYPAIPSDCKPAIQQLQAKLGTVCHIKDGERPCTHLSKYGTCLVKMCSSSLDYISDDCSAISAYAQGILDDCVENVGVAGQVENIYSSVVLGDGSNPRQYAVVVENSTDPY